MITEEQLKELDLTGDEEVVVRLHLGFSVSEEAKKKYEEMHPVLQKRLIGKAFTKVSGKRD